MPYQQQKFILLQRHDAENWDLYVNVRARALGDNHRYSVIVPRRLSREQILQVATALAVYVRLDRRISTVFVRKDQIYASIRQQLYREEVAARPRPEPALRIQDVAAQIRAGGNLGQQIRDATRNVMAPDALAVAKELLRQTDAELLAKIELGKAFYFTTPAFRYIWYPRDRAIVCLEEDGPKYVCVHSTDPTVEQNTYDWALTMRTYLLGNEAHWRAKAYFHNEFTLRGGRDAYEQRDDPNGTR